MKGMTESEVLAVGHRVPTVLKECPLCGGRTTEPRFFHCAECGYLQCYDSNGYYDAQRTAMREKEVRE